MSTFTSRKSSLTKGVLDNDFAIFLFIRRKKFFVKNINNYLPPPTQGSGTVDGGATTAPSSPTPCYLLNDEKQLVL